MLKSVSMMKKVKVAVVKLEPVYCKLQYQLPTILELPVWMTLRRYADAVGYVDWGVVNQESSYKF